MRFANRPYAAVVVAASIVAAGIGAAQAQSTAASGSVVVLPIVAQTSSYTTEVFVRNPNTSPLTIDVTFNEGTNSGTPGSHVCNQLSVPANQTVQFTLSGKCSLTPPPAGHFGTLVLEDASSPQVDQFFAYSRTQTPSGNGFSVEGFPIGNFSGAVADVIGLKRQAASPHFQSNCFVGALSEGFSYQVLLFDSSNNLVGPPLTGTLQPSEMTKLPDVGASAGDYSNVRANFSVTSGGAPAMVAFCTVQESTFFGADFRIAKSQDALNDGQRRLACLGQDQCGIVSSIQPEHVDDVTKKNIYSMIITPPDFVRCDLVGARTSDLQIRLREWGDYQSSPVFPSSAPYTSGGSGQSFFYIYTGGRNAINGGTATRWFIDVSFRTGGNATVPINFGITCRSGNGTEVPWLRAVVNNDFS